MKGWLGAGVKDEAGGRREGAGVAWTACRKLRRCTEPSTSSCNYSGHGDMRNEDNHDRMAATRALKDQSRGEYG